MPDSDVSFLDSSEFNEDEISEVDYFDVDDFMESDGLDGPDDLEALINIAKADPHTFTKETNRYCQLILNHSELSVEAFGLPGILQCYNRYNDGLKDYFGRLDHGSTGMWLFKRDTSTPLQGVKLSSGLVAEWDPDLPLGLAVVVPSEEVKGAEENKHALKMHFGGRRNLVKNSNVIYLHSEKSRTDKRIKARCYFRIREQIPSPDSATSVEPIYPTLELSECSSDGYDFVDSKSSGGNESNGEIIGGANGSGGGGGGHVARSKVTCGAVLGRVSPRQAASEITQGSVSPVGEAAEEMLRLLPVMQMRKLLQSHDEDAKQQILHFISNKVFEASKTPLSPDEDNADSVQGNQGDRVRKAEGEVPSDVHLLKSMRKKGAAEFLNLSEPLEVLFERSLDLVTQIESDFSDEEAKLQFEVIKDEIKTRCNVQDARAETFVPKHEAMPVEVEPSEHVYGELISEAGVDLTMVGLYNDLDDYISNNLKRSSSDDNRDSIIIDAQSWEDFRARMEVASVHFEDPVDSSDKKVPKPEGGTLKEIIAFRDSIKREMDKLKSPEKTFAKAASNIEKGARDVSHEIVWTAAQSQYSAAEVFGAAGPPIQAFMSKEQEQRARMAALFEKVDPSKLAMLDELVEKRKSCKNVFGISKDGFEQMWKSYKQKWGAKAVDEAFSKVKEKKTKFYRAKKVALFTAKNTSMLSEVDVLMKKHEGKYEELYKYWVSTKKFDAHALAAAHATAMQQLQK